MARQLTLNAVGTVPFAGGARRRRGRTGGRDQPVECSDHQRCLGLSPPTTFAYDYSSPIDPQGLGDPLLLALIRTPAFQRLKDIRFLGGIDYCLVPSPSGPHSATKYTREQHSLGVLRLALRYCEQRTLDQKARRRICAAALLHDIGHPPFSHSMERTFEECLGLEHHKATEDIVLGRVPLGKEILSVLRYHDVDPDRVVSLISGQYEDDRFFYGPINFDTMEAICRCYTYLHVGISPNPEDIMLAALNRRTTAHRKTVDDFWTRKDDVYRLLIGSRRAVLADLACQLYLRRHVKDIGIEDYFGTERGVFAKLIGLKDLLESPQMERKMADEIGDTVAHLGRMYTIDASADFFQWRDTARYRYTPSEQVLDLTKSMPTTELAEEGKEHGQLRIV